MWPPENFIDYLMYFLLGLAGLIVLGMLGFGLYAGINWLALPTQTTMAAKIVEIAFKAEHDEWRMAGKTSRLVTIPDTWCLDIQLPTGHDYLAIRHAPWAWQAKTRQVVATYTVTRLSGDISVTGISEGHREHQCP